MRKLFIIILIFICSTACAQRANISLERTNIFYLGVDNHITVLVENCNCNELELESNCLKITPIKDSNNTNCEFIVHPKRYGRSEINVFSKKNGLKKLVLTKSYRIHRVQNLMPSVAHKSGGPFKKASLMWDWQVGCYIKDLMWHVGDVTEFKVLIELKKDKKKLKKKFNTCQFNDTLYDMIELMKSGDEISFYDIKCQTKTNDIIDVPGDVRFTIFE